MLLTTNRNKQNEYLEEFTATHLIHKKSSKCNDSLIHYTLTLGFLVSILSTILLSMQAGTSAELLIASTTTRIQNTALTYLPKIVVGSQGDLDDPIPFLHEASVEAILASSAEATRKRKEKGLYDERIQTLQTYLDSINRIQADLYTFSQVSLSELQEHTFLQEAKQDYQRKIGHSKSHWLVAFGSKQEGSPSSYQYRAEQLARGDPISLLHAYNAPESVETAFKTKAHKFQTAFERGSYGVRLSFKQSQIDLSMPSLYEFDQEFYSIDSVIRPITSTFPNALQNYLLAYLKHLYITYNRRASERAFTVLTGNNEYQKIAKELDEQQDTISIINAGIREFSTECIRSGAQKHSACNYAAKLEADLPKSLNRILNHGLTLPKDLFKYVLRDLRRGSGTKFTVREILRQKYLDDVRREPNLAVQLGFVGVGVAVTAGLIGIGYGLSYIVNTGILQVAMRLAAAAEHKAAMIEERTKGERVLQIMRMRFEAEKMVDLNSRSKPLPLVAE